MTILDIAKDLGLEMNMVSTANGGEYSSPCPMCGGVDRFRIWPKQGDDGRWWCRGCDKKGDTIQLLIEAKDMSFPDACAYIGRELPKRKKARRVALPDKEMPEWPAREITEPVDEWKLKAEVFTGWAHRHLLYNKKEMGWLKTRGITEKTVRRFKLGWNPEDLYRSRSSWGVFDNKRKLWLPKGLAIPWNIDNEIHRLRIRRPDESLRHDDNLRYYVIPGSGMAPMVIVGETKRACVVVESELDAILIAQEVGDIVSVVALGNSSAHPDKIAKDLLSAADYIMIALDFDKAGANGWSKWKEQYLQAERWPVPEGGDPGEYFKGGGDIREWILAGLPPGLKPSPLKEAAVRKSTPISITKESKYPNGYIKKERPCYLCGKNLTLYVFPGQSTRIPCFECAERSYNGYTRKSA